MSFKDYHQGVIVCSHVFKKERDVLYVANEKFGWQFMCGEYEHEEADGIVVGVGHLTDRDPTINTISDLPLGWEAERADLSQDWKRGEIAC